MTALAPFPTTAPPAPSAPPTKPKPKRVVGQATYFLPYQARWIKDHARLRICEKSRQIGMSYADSYDSVRRCAPADARLDVWVGSRDLVAAKGYLNYCVRWAKILNYAAEDLGQIVVDPDKDITAFALRFANGQQIYSLSSSPDAFAGKTGHVKLDEFALHRDQRELYRIAKPVIQWGGTLSVISTHRGTSNVFAEIIRDIREKGNTMGWSLHSIPVQKAVEEGIVERINSVTGATETRAAWLARQRAECLDEEQWLQEYCCIPADENSAFITYEMIGACEHTGTMKDANYLADAKNPLYLGMDVARKHDLCVIDVGERVGDVMHDRVRLELRGKTFAEMKHELFSLLALPQVKRACIDATGMGMQLAEEAKQRYGWRVEPITFTQASKEELAFGLRASFEDRALRLEPSAALRADLRGIKKEVTLNGNIRFAGEAADSHCDRFWALALRQFAAKPNKVEVFADVA